MNQPQYSLRCDPRLDHLIGLMRERSELDDARIGAKPAAIGLVISVLRWTAQNAPSGDLSLYSPSVIADAIEWEQGADLMMQLLEDSGFVNTKRQFIGLKRMLEAQKPSLTWMHEEKDADYE